LPQGVSDDIYAEASAQFSEKELAYLLGRRGDQCLEPFWRRLSLDLASAPGGARCGVVNQRAESNDDFLG
jgi:hypothetical protein